MQVDILPSEQQVLDLCPDGQLRQHDVLAVFTHTIERTLRLVIEITNRKRTGGPQLVHAGPEAWMQAFHTIEHTLCMSLFPRLIGCTTTPHSCITPLGNSRKGHQTIDDHLRGIVALGIIGRCHIHEATRPGLCIILSMLPDKTVVVLIIASMIDVSEGLRLQFDIQGESRISVGDGGYPHAIRLGECPSIADIRQT